MPNASLSLLERFLLKVQINQTGCWLWHGSRSEDGYGRLKRDSRNVSAASVAYEFANGKIPEGMWILHHCDNPPCVRPSHLFLGTRADNMADKIRKDRCAKGERMSHAKMTNKKVLAMRAQFDTGKFRIGHLAQLYQVSYTVAFHVCKRNSWKHVA